MRHSDQVLKLLQKQIGNDSEVKDIQQTAADVVSKWVNPLSGGVEEINGLVYGLVQSGKTGVLSVTGAMGADEGYKTLIILTSDSDPLYDQTLGRIREAFPGIDIIGKSEFKDADSFLQRIKGGTCAIVTTKNARLLKTLIENFKRGGVKGLSSLIIDDEADQASPNTRASIDDGTRSAINDRINGYAPTSLIARRFPNAHVIVHEPRFLQHDRLAGVELNLLHAAEYRAWLFEPVCFDPGSAGG
jgi:hypothetical protein